MKRFVFFSMLFLLIGCSDTAPKVESACPDACEGPTPICDEARGLCVACLDDVDCEGRCFDDRCHECTLATEALDCGETSCDHREAPFACTDTRRGSLGLLDVCRVDSECRTDLGFACVQTYFQGEEDGTHCLKRASLDGCQQPAKGGAKRTSASSDEEDLYCVFSESRVSASAVRAMMDEKPCDPEQGEADCGRGGLCRLLPTLAGYRCTVPCITDADCSTGATEFCLPEGFCGSGESS